MEKIKTDGEDNKEPVAKGRKRKKSLKVDVKEASDVCGEAGPPTEEVDPITATINAVLANASTIIVKPKKMKRAKKQDQNGSVVKTPKQNADDVEDNDDDSSTAGNKED